MVLGAILIPIIAYHSMLIQGLLLVLRNVRSVSGHAGKKNLIHLVVVGLIWEGIMIIYTVESGEQVCFKHAVFHAMDGEMIVGEVVDDDSDDECTDCWGERP